MGRTSRKRPFEHLEGAYHWTDTMHRPLVFLACPQTRSMIALRKIFMDPVKFVLDVISYTTRKKNFGIENFNIQERSVGSDGAKSSDLDERRILKSSI